MRKHIKVDQENEIIRWAKILLTKLTNMSSRDLVLHRKDLNLTKSKEKCIYKNNQACTLFNANYEILEQDAIRLNEEKPMIFFAGDAKMISVFFLEKGAAHAIQSATILCRNFKYNNFKQVKDTEENQYNP